MKRLLIPLLIALLSASCAKKETIQEVEEVTELTEVAPEEIPQFLSEDGMFMGGDTSDSRSALSSEMHLNNRANAILAGQRAIISAFYTSYCRKKGKVLETELRKTCTRALVGRAKTYHDDDLCDTSRFGCGLEYPGEGPWELLDIVHESTNTFIVSIREGSTTSKLRVICAQEDGSWKLDKVTRISVSGPMVGRQLSDTIISDQSQNINYE